MGAEWNRFIDSIVVRLGLITAGWGLWFVLLVFLVA